MRIEDIVAREEAKKKLQKPQSENKREIPDYEKDFGSEEAELIVMDIFKNRGLIVEEVERGTKGENCEEKVDFWVKIVGLDDPLGIQLTISDNEDKIEEKTRILNERSWFGKKENRPESRIKWSGRADLVLIRLKKKTLVDYYEKSKEKGVDVSELVKDWFVREIYSQIFVQLDKNNPIKKDIIYNIFKRAFDKKIKKKS